MIMRVVVQMILLVFLLLSCAGVWKAGKMLLPVIEPRRSLLRMLLYIIAYFAMALVVIVVFDFLMIYLVEHYAHRFK